MAVLRGRSSRGSSLVGSLPEAPTWSVVRSTSPSTSLSVIITLVSSPVIRRIVNPELTTITHVDGGVLSRASVAGRRGRRPESRLVGRATGSLMRCARCRADVGRRHVFGILTRRWRRRRRRVHVCITFSSGRRSAAVWRGVTPASRHFGIVSCVRRGVCVVWYCESREPFAGRKVFVSKSRCGGEKRDRTVSQFTDVCGRKEVERIVFRIQTCSRCAIYGRLWQKARSPSSISSSAEKVLALSIPELEIWVSLQWLSQSLEWLLE